MPSQKIIDLDEKTKYNETQKLFVFKESCGYTTLGLEVAKRKTKAICEWLSDHPFVEHEAPEDVLKAYRLAMAQAHNHHLKTGERCPAELSPKLIGLEGKRVEVTHPHGEKERFIVGKSTGWMPCHLAIPRKNNSGGPAVCMWPESKVRVL